MDYCRNHGIKRQFSIARTPQQNGVVERKNRTVQEMARTMIMDSKLTDIFWTQAMHTAVHIQNRVMLRNNTDKTLDISKKQKSLDYGIQKENIYHLLPTQMQIGQVVLMTDEAPVEQRST
jgi:transposase InsO family protein